MLTSDQLDVLREIVNVGVGQAAGSLNEMIDSYIELDVPVVSTLSADVDDEGRLLELGQQDLSCVRLQFFGNFGGSAAIVFPPESAANLVVALTGEDPGTPRMDELMAGTLNEVGNIVVNGIIGSLSNMMDTPLDFTIPEYVEGKWQDLIHGGQDKKDIAILLVQTGFSVKDLKINGNIFLVFELNSFDRLLTKLDEMIGASSP